jgi:O-antigen ligase
MSRALGGAGPRALESAELQRALAWSSVVLLYVGEMRVPVQQSELYLPAAVVPLAALAALRARGGTLRMPSPAWALAGVLAAAAVATAASEWVGPRRGAAATVPVAVAMLGVVALAGVDDLARVVRSAVAWGGALLSAWVLALAAVGLADALSWPDWKQAIETPLGRSNFLAAFLLFFVATVWGRSRGLVALGVLAMVCTLSRGGLIALVLFLLLQRLARVPGRAERAAVAVIVAGLLAVAAASWPRGEARAPLRPEFDGSLPAAAVHALASPASVANRVRLWQAAHTMIADSPWLGAGPNGFRSRVELDRTLEDVWGPHNAVMLLWLNYGLAGLAAYLAWLLAVLRAVDRARARAGGAQACAWPPALHALLAFALIEPLVGSASFELLLAVCCAAGLAGGRR